MTQAELVTELAQRAGVSQAAARRLLRSLADLTNERVAAGDELHISRVGKFGSRWRKRTTIRDIRRGSRMMLGARFVPQFKASAQLRRSAGERTEQHWRDPEHQRAWRLAEALVSDLELYGDGTPPALAPITEPTEVHQRCAEVYGDAWARAVETYGTEVPAEVRGARDYLTQSAVERWGTGASHNAAK